MRRLCAPLAAMLTAWVVSVEAQPPPSEEAVLGILDSACRGFNEKKYDFAIERFREFLKLYPGHAQAALAHYGLGLALLHVARPEPEAALQSLVQSAANQAFPKRAEALYYMGLARRSLGDQAMERAYAKPAEATQHRAAAVQQYTEAAKHFAEAATVFLARVGTPLPATNTPDLEWAARARCDQCDMLLRLGQFKEARALAESVLNEIADGSRFREHALYHIGYACYALGDFLDAGRALSRLAPFQQSFGLSARYLLGRIHHLQGERPEAALQYRAVITEYDTRRKAAEEALKNPAALTSEQKLAHEAALKPEMAEYALRSLFHLALVECEAGRFPQAFEAFGSFVQRHPNSPLVPEAVLRQAYCRMQTGGHAEAAKLLQPLTTHPTLGDRAMWWLARCQLATANAKDAAAYKVALQGAMDLLRKAAVTAGQIAQSQPQAKARRGEILIELGDAMQLAGLYREAAETYQSVLQENNNPDRTEEVLQRRITALHLAGLYAESDQLCTAFEQSYPKSPLLAAVWFRRAENARQMALAAASNTNLPNRETEVARLLGEAIRRYRALIARFPAFEYVNLAREGAGSAYYQLGQYADAITMFNSIPFEARSSELAVVPYIMADCHIHCADAERGTDALSLGRQLRHYEQAVTLLNSFLATDEKTPQMADALFKLGYCHRRMAALVANAEDRKKLLGGARAAWDRLLQQFPQDALVPDAIWARADGLALLGDVGSAASELARFQQDPLRQSSVAPLALLRLASLLRVQKRAQEGAKVLEQCRGAYEAVLLKDPKRANWVPVLLHEQGLCLLLADKPLEAVSVFEELVRRFPENQAALSGIEFMARARRAELRARLGAARGVFARSGAASAQEVEAARKAVEDAALAMRNAVARVHIWSGILQETARGAEMHQRLLYEAAWCHRALAEAESELAAQRWREEAVTRARKAMPPQSSGAEQPGSLRVPEPQAPDVLPSADELAARRCYEQIAGFATDSPLATRARIELADLQIRQGEFQAAKTSLGELISRGPDRETLNAVRARLAAAALVEDDPATALTHAEAILGAPPGPLTGYAMYLAGEACFRQRNWNKAIERLTPFRDAPAWQNVPDLTDRALLRLGQACLEKGDGGTCRQTLQTLLQRFPQSPWIDEALYTVGISYQKEKRYDQAVEAYLQLVRKSVSEWAARAQYQIGMCRMEQKKYEEAVQALLAVPLTYDYVHWHPPALYEAARACEAMNQKERAGELWRRIVENYPLTPWAKSAAEELKKENVGR